MAKLCKHLWVNFEGCLMCGKTLKQIGDEGYTFVPLSTAVPYREIKEE